MDHGWWCSEDDSCDCNPDEPGRAGGADLAEIRCSGDAHVGCDHDPDRIAAL